MNRIRPYNGNYQVLYTPNLVIAPSMELVIGNWEDEHFRNFYIKEFPTLPDAQCAAFQLPDLDWYKLVRIHVDYFHHLSKLIGDVLSQHRFIVDYKPNLMDPQVLKEVTFNRVMQLGNRFNMTYGMNDIISFCIVNPWTANLTEIADVLASVPQLRIRRKRTYDGKMIHLIGYTELGSTYEIKLWPTVLYQWVTWKNDHIQEPIREEDDFHAGYGKHVYSREAVNEEYKKALLLQDKLDGEDAIR